MAEGSDFSVEPKARTCWPKRAGVAAKHWSLGIKDLYIFAYKLLSVFLKSCINFIVKTWNRMDYRTVRARKALGE